MTSSIYSTFFSFREVRTRLGKLSASNPNPNISFELIKINQDRFSTGRIHFFYQGHILNAIEWKQEIANIHTGGMS